MFTALRAERRVLWHTGAYPPGLREQHAAHALPWPRLLGRAAGGPGNDIHSITTKPLTKSFGCHIHPLILWLRMAIGQALLYLSDVEEAGGPTAVRTSREPTGEISTGFRRTIAPNCQLILRDLSAHHLAASRWCPACAAPPAPRSCGVAGPAGAMPDAYASSRSTNTAKAAALSASNTT